MMIKFFILMISFALVGCSGNSLLKKYPEKENLEAALDSLRIRSEVELKLQICDALKSNDFESYEEEIKFERNKKNSQKYYHTNVQPFNREINEYLMQYSSDYRNSFEPNDIQNIQNELVGKPSRLATAKYFSIDSKEVKDNLSKDSYATYYNPYLQVIRDALEQRDVSIISECNKLYEDITNDMYNPNFSKYKSEYKSITGLERIKN